MGNEKRRIIDPKMTVMGYIIQKRINMEKEYERFLGCLCPEDKKYYEETKNKAIKTELRFRLSLCFMVIFTFVPAMISLALDFFGEYLPKDTSLFVPIFSTRISVFLLLLSFFFLPLTLYLRGKQGKRL